MESSSPSKDTFAETSNLHRPTPSGYEHPVKSSILARFRPDLKLPLSFAGMSEFTEIWMDELLLPVSRESFSPEEETIFSSGQLASNSKKQHGPTRGGARGGHRGRGGRQNGTERELAHSFEGSSSFTNRMKDFPAPDRNDSGTVEEDALWNMPQTEDSLGTFDEKGNFSVGGALGGMTLEQGLLSSSMPGHDRLPPPGRVMEKKNDMFMGSMSQLTEKKEDALVSPTTQWYYRDPAGQIQGPFQTKKMLHWYTRNYFPESLPLRRDCDILFEPLSVWKSKCGGVCPFELEAGSPSSRSSAASSIISPDIGPSSTIVPSRSSASASLPAPISPPAPTASIFAKLGLPWTGPTKPEPEVLPTSKEPNLAEDQLVFLKQFNIKPSAETTNSAGLISSERPIERRPFTTGSSEVGWKKLETSPVAAFEIAPPSNVSKPTSTAPMPKAIVSPLELMPANSPSVGWSRPVSKSRPLSEIMREEAEMEAARRASQPKNAPKSFAETLRAAEANRPPVKPMVSPIASVPATKPSHAKTASTTSPSNLTHQAKQPDTKSWCLAQLKPLEASYDINMCTILLMELRTPVEIAGFIEDNMKSTRMDMRAFMNELVERRFGVPTPVETPSEDVEFQTVGRKQHRKKL